MERGQLAYETARRYADLLQRLEELGDVDVATLATPSIHAWHERLASRRRRDGELQLRTADYCRDTLALVCRHAELLGWRDPESNPVRAVRRFGSKPRECRLTEEECRAILGALRTIEARRTRRRFKAPLQDGARLSATTLIRVLFLWARRPRELRLLRWAQVDLDGPRPAVRRMSTKRGVRTMPVPGPVLQLLRRQQERVGDLSEWVFPSSTGRPLSTLWHVWREVTTVAGLPPMPLYALRHNAATHWLEAGMTHEEVASVLGNTAATVRYHYDHAVRSPLDERAAEAAATLMRRIGGGS